MLGRVTLGLVFVSLLLLVCWLASEGAGSSRCKLIATLERDPSHFVSVAFSPDGKTLAAGGLDPVVILWDVATQGVKATLEMPPPVSSGPIAFSPDGKSLAAAHLRTVYLWDLPTGKSRELGKHTAAVGKAGAEVGAVAFSPDGKVVASSDANGIVKLWGAATGKGLATLDGKEFIWDRALTFSPDGSLLAAGGGKDSLPSFGQVLVWDVGTRRLHGTLRGHELAVRCVAFSPDGEVLVSGSYEGALRLWEAKTGKLKETRKGGIGPIDTVAFTPDGRVLAAAGGHASAPGDFSKPGRVRFWDTASGKDLGTLKAHQTGITSIAFSPDGKLLAVACGENSVKLWDVSAITGQAPGR